MPKEHDQATSADLGVQSEALSNEVLKLKIDDLFQEIENLKARVARLEGGPADADLKGVASDHDDARGGAVPPGKTP